VVDDDATARAEVLEAVQAADIHVVGTTDSGQHALELAAMLQPDVALIAWNMRRFGGALTASLMPRYAPDVTSVMMLQPEDVAEVRKAPLRAPLRSVMRHGDAKELRTMLRAIHRYASARRGVGSPGGKGVVDVREG
jgi:DNA-binding NarL/FixJ family response regulator